MTTSFLRCRTENGRQFKISHDSEIHIKKVEDRWLLHASSINGTENTIRVFEKQIDAEYTRLCLKQWISNKYESNTDQPWDASTFKSLSDAWREAAEKLSGDADIQNIKSLMKSSKLVITIDKGVIAITIKYPYVCKDWGDALQEYKSKIECNLSLECPYFIKWKGASLKFQEYDHLKPNDL